MPLSETDICNKALLRIGHTRFLDGFRPGALNQPGDGSLEADVCNRSYDDCRDEVLSSARWPFATRRWLPAQIDPTTLMNGVVPSGWGYAYALPADIISFKRLVPGNLVNLQLLPVNLDVLFSGVRADREDQEVPYTIEYDGKLQKNIILTDSPSPEWQYIAQVTDPTLFDANFVNALAWRLAVELAPGLRKDVKVTMGAKQMFDLALGDAVASAKREVRPDPEPVPSWIAARGG